MDGWVVVVVCFVGKNLGDGWAWKLVIVNGKV